MCMEEQLGTVVDEGLFEPQNEVMEVPVPEEKKPSSKRKSGPTAGKSGRTVPPTRRYLPGSTAVDTTNSNGEFEL